MRAFCVRVCRIPFVRLFLCAFAPFWRTAHTAQRRAHAMSEDDRIAAANERLHSAAKSGRLKEAKRAVGDGADVCVAVHSYKPLGIAAENGHLEVCRWLVEKGADPSEAVWSLFAQTALILAAGEGHAPVVQLLLRSRRAFVDDLAAKRRSSFHARSRAVSSFLRSFVPSFLRSFVSYSTRYDERKSS